MLPGSVALQLIEDGRVFGKLIAHLALVPELSPVRVDDEITAATLDQLNLRLGMLFADWGVPTGRLRLVISLHAVFDLYLHH